MQDIGQVREFFTGDRYAMETGARIDEVGDHYAKVSMTVNEHHRNAVGGVMGGVYFTLADFAFAVAANWQEPGVVAVDSSISFIGVPATEQIYAEARLVKAGRTISCYIVEVRDGNGTPVAEVKTLGYRKC
ncbi:MAG: PaaI family thioesterase [Ruminococcus sp.]|nr:PaaI family thioesterase [Ruminococcus sp.]